MISKPESEWHIRIPKELGDSQPELFNLRDAIITALKNLKIIYYRPYIHVPAMRFEIAKSIADNNQRLAIIFESLKMQCGAPGMLEPYPLYLADRMVKHLRTALPAISKTTTQEMSYNVEDNLGNIYFAMHGYRTESRK